MASLVHFSSTYLHSASTASRFPSYKPAVYVSKSVGLLRKSFIPDYRTLFLLRPAFSRSSRVTPSSITTTSSSPKLDSLLLLCTSLALSFSFFIGDVGSASAFVVISPRKLQSDELATVRLFQETTPSVVYITNLAAKMFTLDIMEVPQGSGSGFIWDTEGRIVTNYHVIRAASDLRVTLAYQTTYDAKVVGFDQDKDVAVLRVDAPKDKLRPDVSNDLLVGQKVYAIGNPILNSGLRREISSAATGLPIQDVIGINTAIYSPSGASSGVGFSIPVDTVSGIVDQLARFEKVARPILGIMFAPDQSVEQLGVSGVLVLDAPADGPAGLATLQT